MTSFSSYVYDRQPKKYGDQQQDYLARSEKIVTQAADSFRTAVSKGANLVALFKETMAAFEKERKDIAFKHQSEDKELFGKKRDTNSLTPLGHPYVEYNDRIVAIIQKQLTGLQADKKEFRSEEEEKVFGSKSRIEVRLLPEKLPAIGQFLYMKCCKQAKVQSKKPYNDNHLLDFIANKNLMQKLRKASPETYNDAVSAIVLRYWQNHPNYKFILKPTYILATRHLEMNGKSRQLSQYFTWMFKDAEDGPVKSMSEFATITVMHQDPYTIDETMEECAKIFEKIIKWDGKNLDTLKQNVALFEYQFAHAMPQERGSGAIAEWFERALFQCHNYKLTHDKSIMMSFEAYASSLGEFVQNYGKMVTLTKIEKPKSESTDKKV